VLVFVLGLYLTAAMLKYQDSTVKTYFPSIPAVIGLFLLLILLTEEIYMYWYWLARTTGRHEHYLFLGQMWISVTWALYATCTIAVGLWQRISLLRYISMALYVLVLAKVFIFDMSTRMSSTYRIAGFIVLGSALIGVSYLYQFCKNKGLFQNTLPEKPEQDPALTQLD